MKRALMVVFAAWLLTACGTSGGLRARALASSAQKPGQVAIYVRVEDQERRLVDLEPKDLTLRENGVTLSNDDVKLALLPREPAVSHRALLLVDMSRTLPEKERASALRRLRALITKLRQEQPVTVFAYDGAERAHLIGDYARDARAEPDEKDTSLEKMAELSQEDSSSSLYSALLFALQELDARFAKDRQPVHVGTVVLVVQRPDLAGRVAEAEVRDGVRRSGHHFFLASIGDWEKEKKLDWLGRDGRAQAASFSAARAAFDDLAERVSTLYYGHYLVAYCSPGREGIRSASIEIRSTDEAGKERKARLSTRFDSTGFGPGCDPRVPPKLVPIAATREVKDARSKVKDRAKPTAPPAPKPSEAAPPKEAPIAEPPSGMGYE